MLKKRFKKINQYNTTALSESTAPNIEHFKINEDEHQPRAKFF